jgi:glycosyltransferase involved in cell wall biosynthesis
MFLKKKNNLLGYIYYKYIIHKIKYKLHINFVIYKSNVSIYIDDNLILKIYENTTKIIDLNYKNGKMNVKIEIDFESNDSFVKLNEFQLMSFNKKIMGKITEMNIIKQNELIDNINSKDIELIDNNIKDSEIIDNNTKDSNLIGNILLIALPTYNRPFKCIKVIGDILNQTDVNYKLCIIDDGSEINNYNILNEFVKIIKNDKIILMKNDENKGIGYSLNKAINYLNINNYTHFSWISDDNEYYNNFINKLISKYEFNYTSYIFNSYTKIINVNKKYNDINDLINNFNGMVSFCWTKELINKIGLYNENIQGCEDYDYLVRTFINTQSINHINEFTSRYMLHNESLYTVKKDKIDILKQNIDTIYKFLLKTKIENIFCYYSKNAWKLLFQRPHQIMRHYNNKYLKIFITSDNVVIYEEQYNLLIISYNLRNIFFEFIKNMNINKIIYYTDSRLYNEIDDLTHKYNINKILFDLIDAPIDEFSIWKNNLNLSVNNASHVMYSHPDLIKFLKEINEEKKYHYISNACDYEHFNKSKNRIYPKPDDIPKTDKKILGYYGAFAKWLDYDLIKKYADDGLYHILMIGGIQNGYNEKIEHNNITWLEHKSYEELPIYLSWFDVCFLPFKSIELNKYVNPCKLWEYMASEKEIIKHNVNINNDQIITYDVICEKINKIIRSNLKEYNKILTFIINLENQNDRFEKSKKQLENMNLNIIRYDAIVGKNIINRNEYINYNNISKYTHGQFGCMLSHLQLILNFYLNYKNDYCLICEDDVELFNPHNLNIYQIIDNAPKNWEKIKLSYISDNDFYDKILQQETEYLTDEFCDWTMGTACYLISRLGAKKLINKFYKNNKWNIYDFVIELNKKTIDDRLPIDKWLFSFENNYIFKYPIFTYNYVEISETTQDLNEIVWSNNSKKHISEQISKIELNNPLISIILPTYNGLDKIKKTIKYILEQSFKNFELIIIIDGSTDNTYEYLIDLRDKLKDNRIHICYQTNKKLPTTLNEGIIRCRGEYITWTSDDNYPRDNWLYELYTYLNNNNNIDFVYSNQRFFGDGEWYIENKISNLDMYFDYPGLASFMWTNRIIKKIGYYDNELNGIEDYDYILRTIELNPNIGYVKKILYDYYFEQSGNNMTSHIMKNNKLEMLNIKLLRNIISRNNGLPSFDILFSDNKINNYKSILNTTITNSKKAGYSNYLKKYVK